MKLWRSTLCVVGLVSALGTVYAQGQEMSLLGVRLLNPVMRVFDMYGNPFQISPQYSQIQRTSMFGGQQGGGGGSPLMGGPSGGGGMSGGSGMLAPPPGMGGEGGGGMLGGPSGGGGMPNPGGTDAQFGSETETLYRYQVKGGYTYQFLANKDGRVIQINAYGLKPNPRVRTKRGITLGDTYKKVVKAYGYPTEHEYSGLVYALRYNKLNVAFILDAKKHTVIAIIVAAGIPRTGMGFAGGGGGQQPGMGGGDTMGGGGMMGGSPGRGAGPPRGGMGL
jgi:hypothetical protein